MRKDVPTKCCNLRVRSFSLISLGVYSEVLHKMLPVSILSAAGHLLRQFACPSNSQHSQRQVREPELEVLLSLQKISSLTNFHFYYVCHLLFSCVFPFSSYYSVNPGSWWFLVLFNTVSQCLTHIRLDSPYRFVE